jgi:putative hydrolase of the HAD superfamily
MTKHPSHGGDGPWRAIFFDAGNTLLRPWPSVGHIYAQTARRHGLALTVEWVERRFQSAWRSRHDLSKPRNDHHERRWWKVLVKRVFGERFAPRAFNAFFDELYDGFAHPRHWRFFPDALSTLRAVRRRGLRVGVVSNWDTRLLRLSDRLGLTKEVEFLLVSSVEGVAKPQAELFRRALAKAGVAAEEALHIGDSLVEDYWGARGAGLHARLLHREAAPPKRVSVITSLRDVVALLPVKNRT